LIMLFLALRTIDKMDSATHQCMMLARAPKKDRHILLDPYCFLNLR
jgi:hypothetical protein